ncbi:hypothetical protein KIPB_011686, partial [Kipferlia bialata]|eukprot:g11686.t1
MDVEGWESLLRIVQ